MSSLSTRQRCDHILALIYKEGRVTVKGLADELSVSEATVRRDLRSLADAKKIELVYGGATTLRSSDFSFQSKAVRNAEEKRVVARLTAELIDNDDHIFLDSGTTCYELAPLLKGKQNLSVIVNSARLVLELNGSAGLSIIILGGQYRSDRMDSTGPLATSTLDRLRGYKAFIGADGLSMEFGVTANDIESADLYGLAVKNARECVLMVDHTKFTTPSLYKICEWPAVSRIVSDRKPSEEWTQFLDSHGIEIIYPTN